MSDNFLTTIAKKAETDGVKVKGFEDIDSQAISIPFIKLLQQLSPELNNKKDKFIKGAVIGMFTNSVTNELIGKKLKVIVLGFERVYIEWKPDRGGLVGYHTPGEAEKITVCHDFAKWKTAEGNNLVETYMYRCLVVGQEDAGMVVLSLTSTNISIAKAWNRQLVTTIMDNGIKALPHFLIWEISSTYTEKGTNSWYKYQVDFAGYVNETQYAIVTNNRKTLETKQVAYQETDNKVSGEDKQEVNY